MNMAEMRVTPKLERVFIGLGSNIEPRLEYLKIELNGLLAVGEIARISPVYETAPVGNIPQPHFLNAVIELQTAIGPLELFIHLKNLEKTVGRKERPRWHEREIDLDLLFYGDLILESATLTVPHAELHRRAFVLVPMRDLDPDFMHPVLKKSVAELLSNVDATGVNATTYTL